MTLSTHHLYSESSSYYHLEHFNTMAVGIDTCNSLTETNDKTSNNKL